MILENLFDNNNGWFFFTSFVFSFLNFVPFLEGNFKILTPQCHGHAATGGSRGARGAAAPPIAGRRGQFNESGFWELGGFKLWGRREAS